MKNMRIKATPVAIRFHEDDGYVLLVKIEDGPATMVGRTVAVEFTGSQLDKIVAWDVEGKSSRLELGGDS